MAIERIEQMRGGWTRVNTVEPGSSERVTKRGFWQTIRTKIGKELVTEVTVITPDALKVRVLEDHYRSPREITTCVLDRDEINARRNDQEVNSGEFGIRRRKITYRWKLSKNNPQDH